MYSHICYEYFPLFSNLGYVIVVIADRVLEGGNTNDTKIENITRYDTWGRLL